MEKRGRELSVSEAHGVLTTTDTKKNLVSWFQPFTSSMLMALHSRAKTIYMDGKQFTIKKCANGTDFVFYPTRDALGFPRTRLSIADLEKRLIPDS